MRALMILRWDVSDRQPADSVFRRSLPLHTPVSSQQGVIVAGGEEYLIEPLVSPDNHTSAERAERAEGRPHVVYKRSSLRHQYKGQSCGVIGERGRYSGSF